MSQQTRINRPVGITVKEQQSLLQQMGYKSSSPHGLFRLEMTSIPHEAYERGRMYMWFVLVNLISAARMYTIPLYTKDPDERTAYFAFTYHVEFSASLYRQSAPKFPLLFDTSINYVKKTSRNTSTTVSHPDMTSPYVKDNGTDVNIDPITSRPKLIPDWWKQTYGPSEAEVHYPPEISISGEKPQHCVYRAERKNHFSDVDYNGHAHSAYLLRHCMDSFYETVATDPMCDGYKRFLSGWVREISVVVKGETILGDILKIVFWENPTSENSFCFEVSKGSRVILLASFTFYISVLDSNL